MYNNENKISIVLIGAGYWGTNVAKNLIKLNIKKFIVFDTNSSNLKILKKKFPNAVIIKNNYISLIKQKKLTHFIFATPPSQNFRLVSKALMYKKKIFIEKPGFKNFTEINLIKKKFSNQLNKIFIGYIYLFNNHIKFIKNFIQNKRNGKILYIKFQRQNLGPIRSDVDVNYDLSSHDISILIFLFTNNIKITNENKHSLLKKNIADISNISLKKNNIAVDINNSWLNPDKIRRITIITTKKMLLFDEMKENGKIKIYNKYASYPKLNKLKNQNFFKDAKVYQGSIFEPKINENDPLLDELKYYLTHDTKKKI